MNGHSNRGEYEPTTRWGPVAVIAAVVLMMVLSVVLFAALSGGSESSGQDPQSAADAPRVSNPAADGEETTGEETTMAASEEQAETSTSDEGDDGENSAPEEPQATNQPVSDDGGNPEEDQGSEDGGSGEQGAVNEPAGFDPLNKNAKPGDLTETDEGRVRLTVSKFVNSAYGFSGDDKTAYAREVEQNVILPDFYDSPGGDAITQRVQNFDADEVMGAAKLNDFEIETTEPDRVVGTATFSTGDSYADNGDVEGGKREYRQRITLAPQGAIYKISAASEAREVG